MKTAALFSGSLGRVRIGPALVLAFPLVGLWFVSWLREKSDPRDRVVALVEKADVIDPLAPGDSLERLLASMHGRDERIEALLELLKRAPNAEKFSILDTLATMQPIEAAASLIEMIHQVTDVALAARILDTLRAGTRITSSENRTNLGDRELIRNLEAIQGVFREELARPARDSGRFRAAVAAIADVFPSDEAEQLFATLETLRLASPETFPMTEPEWLGRWLEFKVGDVEGRDFEQVVSFIREHPSSVADERIKARVAAALDITPIRSEEIHSVSEMLDLLAPAGGPDDSYVRWLKVGERVTGVRRPITELVAQGGPLRQSALVLFGGYDLPRELGVERLAILNRDLKAALEGEEDEENRDFIRAAADSISLGDRAAGGYAAPR